MAEVAIRKNIYQKLLEVQSTLKAPKNQPNTFGNYKYRSAEQILEAVKPLLKEQELIISMTDSIEMVGDRTYLKATVFITDVHTGEKCETVAYAREALQKRGMDEAQVTGTTSSYARKYALNGLFAIDDAKDFDTDECRNECDNRSKKQDEYKKADVAERNEKTKASHELAEKAKSLGVSNETMKAIVQQKYKAERSADMSIGELRNMTANLEALAAEFTA